MLWIIWNAATMMLLIMGIINITNYESTKQSAEQLLNILTDNEGVFPQPEKPADLCQFGRRDQTRPSQ